MLRMSPAGNAATPSGRPTDGYLLLELVAALVLAGLLITMAFPALTHGTNRPRFHALSIGTATLLRNARTDAIARGSEARAEFDRRRRTIQSRKQVVAIPADVEVELLAGSRCETNGGRIQIVFRPDGSNCGGVFRFAHGDHITRVRLNWLTGHIEILQGSGSS